MLAPGVGQEGLYPGQQRKQPKMSSDNAEASGRKDAATASGLSSIQDPLREDLVDYEADATNPSGGASRSASRRGVGDGAGSLPSGVASVETPMTLSNPAHGTRNGDCSTLSASESSSSLDAPGQTSSPSSSSSSTGRASPGGGPMDNYLAKQGVPAGSNRDQNRGPKIQAKTQTSLHQHFKRTNKEVGPDIGKCGKTTCLCCKAFSQKPKALRSATTSKKCQLRRHDSRLEKMTCTSSHLIYVIWCEQCGVQYVGSTKAKLHNHTEENSRKL